LKSEHENSDLKCWRSDLESQNQRVDDNETIDFSANKWKLILSFLMIIQLCKNLFLAVNYVLFMNNYFINARLFKVLRMRDIEILYTIKVDNDFLIVLMIIRTAANKQKNWEKMNLMIIKSNRFRFDDCKRVVCELTSSILDS
jgi:hypothetical protein